MSWLGWRRTPGPVPGLVLVLLLAQGCGKEEMPRTYPVTGKVVLKNGKPYAGGSIIFTSVADPELRGYGQIAADGTFTLSTIAHTSKGRSQNLDGAVEGEFYVNITPNPGNDAAPSGPGGGRPFTLKKTYKVEAKANNEITVVVE